MRLFFGLSLPQDIRAATSLVSSAAREQIDGRYAPAENHHITLAFLGEAPQARLGDARDVLARCLAHHPAPTLTLDGLSHFGRRENAILIIRVRSHPPLDALHAQLIAALQEASLPADPGPFSPHITLARHARLTDALPACPALSFTASHAHLFLSARDEQGVLRYTPLETVPFCLAR